MQSGPISSTLSDIRDFAACPNTPKLQAADLSAGVGESAVRTPTMFAVSRRTLPSLDTLRTQLAINKKLNTLISAAFAFLFLSTGSDDRPRQNGTAHREVNPRPANDWVKQTSICCSRSCRLLCRTNE